MQRREFFRLAGGTLLAIPAGLFLVRAEPAISQTTNPTNQPVRNGTKLIYTSSVVGAHAHTFGIEIAAIDAAPAEGVSGQSSVAENHSHKVVVSAAQLLNIRAGHTVEVTSGSAGAHRHLFTFLKLA
jgi:hypothetical protein